MKHEGFYWPCELTPSAKTALLASAQTIVLDTDDYLKFGKDNINGLFYIMHGLVIASMLNPSKSCPFIVLKTGDWAGEVTIQKRVSLQYQMVSVDSTKIIFIPDHAVKDAAEHYPELYKFLYLLASERPQVVIEMLFASSSMKVTQKVAYFLREISKSFPHVEGSKPMILMSQAMLAQILGLSRASLNEQLTLLEQKNLIEVDRKRIYLNDMPSLESIAEGNY